MCSLKPTTFPSTSLICKVNRNVISSVGISSYTKALDKIKNLLEFQSYAAGRAKKCNKNSIYTNCVLLSRWIQSCRSDDEEEPGESFCGEMSGERGEKLLLRDKEEDRCGYMFSLAQRV